jgi:hypothetical protein
MLLKPKFMPVDVEKAVVNYKFTNSRKRFAEQIIGMQLITLKLC